jgi:hypothetical protein
MSSITEEKLEQETVENSVTPSSEEEEEEEEIVPVVTPKTWVGVAVSRHSR